MNNVVTKVRPHHSARFLHPAYLHVDVFSCSNMPSEDNMVVVMTVMASMFRGGDASSYLQRVIVRTHRDCICRS